MLRFDFRMATEDRLTTTALGYVRPIEATSDRWNRIEGRARLIALIAQVDPKMIEIRARRLGISGDLVFHSDVDRREDHVEAASERELEITGLLRLQRRAQAHDFRLGQRRNVLDSNMEVNRISPLQGRLEWRVA